MRLPFRVAPLCAMTTRPTDNVVATVREIIHEWDPYGLIAGGAPKDEFDREIQSVAEQMARISGAKDTVLALSRVFSSAFEPELFTPDKCEAVGTKLYELLQQRGLLKQGR